MIFTNFINLLHCPPFVSFYFTTKTTYLYHETSISIFLTNLMFLRLYLILRLITNLSQWTNINSEDACEKEGFEASFTFALKGLLKEKPYQMLLINFSCSIIIFGFSVRSFER